MEVDFNTRICLSILTQKPIELQIQPNIEKKMSFVKLVCKLTKGSKFSVKDTLLKFTPGKLQGGTYEYSCTDEIFNYITSLLIILPFSDKKTIIKFTGITDYNDCIDMIRISYFKMLKIFNIPDLDLTVKKRGFFNKEGNALGEVTFSCGNIKELKNIDLIDSEKLEKTRALLISARLNSTYVHDMSTELREVMDTYNLKVFTNICNRNDSGPAPGFQCTLFGESKNGIFYKTKYGDKKPERVAKETVIELFKSICRGGIFDYKMSNLLFVYLSLASTDVSRIRIGRLDDTNKVVLGILKEVFNFNYQIKKDEDGYVFISYGTGYLNYSLKLN